jgi:hypothetical protein
MDENLVGYLLQSLDSETQQQVEASLRGSPELRARLELLERAVAPLAGDADTPEPPPGLVLSTLARIAEHHCRKLPDAPPPPRSQVETAARRWPRRPDVLVAALLLIVLGGLSASALIRVWRDHGRVECRNNLQMVWAGLQRYCDANDGNFPQVEEKGAHGIAGIFVPMLAESGALSPDVNVTCPARGPRPPQYRSVREMEELFEKDRAAFHEEARKLAGTYAYTLGYFDGAGQYRGLRCDSGDTLPIMADRLEFLSQRNSPNHGGDGQNVLYLGGHVIWHTQRTAGIDGDDIFLNWDHRVLAGKAREDTVLGSSDASPTPREE